MIHVGCSISLQYHKVKIYNYCLSQFDLFHTQTTVTYSYACRNIVTTIMTNKRQFFEKYTSHTLFEMVRKGYERVMCERWVGDWTKTATYWPPALLAIAALLSRLSWAAQPGTLWVQLSAEPGSHCFELTQLTQNSDLQLTWTSCSTGLYNCLTPTCFSERRICTQFNLSTVKFIPWYLRPDAPVIYTGAFLIWQLGRIGGQYVTQLLKAIIKLLVAN